MVMRPTATHEEIDGVRRTVEEHGLEAFLSVGEERTVIGVVGSDLERVSHLGTLDGVEQVIRISSPYKLASSEHQVERTRVRVTAWSWPRGRSWVVRPGLRGRVARAAHGDRPMRQARGCPRPARRRLQPRTSLSFQGLGLLPSRSCTKLTPSTAAGHSEIVDPADVPTFEEHVDIIMSAARNMANFVLLKAVGQEPPPRCSSSAA